MKTKSTGDICSVPHGLVVWSTGISTLPVIRDFMKEIGQVLIFIPCISSECSLPHPFFFSFLVYVHVHIVLFSWLKITMYYCMDNHICISQNFSMCRLKGMY